MSAKVNDNMDPELLTEEIKKGGKLSPCPCCKLPRVQRSDYIRCCKCGLNWLEGEDLSANPKIERYHNMRYKNSGEK